MASRLTGSALVAAFASCASDPAPVQTAPAAAPWTSESAALEVGCFGYWSGSMRFRAARDQLSVAELALLDALEVVPPSSSCGADSLGCSISITDERGHLVTYAADSEDWACADLATPVIAYASFVPFLAALPCQFAKTVPLGGTSTMIADERCLNGVFSPSGGGTVSVSLRVDEPRLHRIELTECATANRAGRISATLVHDGSMLEPIEPAAAGPYGTCARLDHAFNTAGTYELRMMIDETFAAGDFALRFY